MLLKHLSSLTIQGSWFFTVMLLIWQGLRYFPGDRWLPIRLGNYFAPWLLLVLLPILSLAILSRQTWLARWLLLLLILVGGHYRTQFIPQADAVQATAPPASQAAWLTVMTFNVNYRNDEVSAIAALIRAEQPDLVALQEVTGPVMTALAATLTPDYPYALIAEGIESRQGLISRYPLTHQPPPSPEPPKRILRAIVETPTGPISVWNLHSRVGLKQALWRAQYSTLQQVAEEVAQTTGPIIVLGDFNTTDQTETYRLLASQLTDVHRAVGRGFGFTFPGRTTVPDSWRYIAGWPTFGPLVRIDMVLVSPHFVPLSSRVISTPAGSDHFPVLVRLQFALAHSLTSNEVHSKFK